MSRITPTLRPDGYLDQILRPATDNIGRALAYTQLSAEILGKLATQRRKLDGWRATLGELSRQPIPSFSSPITRRVHRIRATA